MQAYIVNPSARKRRRKSSKKASPAQLRARAKFAAMARARAKHRRPARRRAHTATVLANPAPRRRRRHVSVANRHHSRRIRRNPISVRSLTHSALGMVKEAAIGGAGAIGVDLIMGQAIKYLPDTMTSRYTTDGTVNWSYYAAKTGLALAAAFAGGKMLPAKARSYVMQAAQGSLIVQAYEIERSLLPAELTLGYYNPARVAAVRRQKLNGMGAYQRTNVQTMPRVRSMGGISDQGDSSAAIG